MMDKSTNRSPPMNKRFVPAAELFEVEHIDFTLWRKTGCGLISQPYGPRGDRYVYGGQSIRDNGGGQERVGTLIRCAIFSCYGEQLPGSIATKAWASPLACPLP